jgi:RimJ/RimL family protein N-acetyltransferase
MKPVTLRTARLVLDRPTADDIDRVTEFCQDPVFETYMVTPWPYQRSDAQVFVTELVPRWWDEGSEYTWAIRFEGELIGMIGFRTQRLDIGFWLGAPYRGNGYMPEATNGVLDWLFTQGFETVLWECFPGNTASVSVARKTGFTFTGVAPSIVMRRDGTHSPAWHGTISPSDSRDPKPGWPA